MSITPIQCRMARTALGWSNAELARRAGVGVNTLSRFEQGADARQSSVNALRAALEAGGLIFVGDGEASLSGGSGVRLSGE
jgi:transcriptional regulator with XRE-family HTH domain